MAEYGAAPRQVLLLKVIAGLGIAAAGGLLVYSTLQRKESDQVVNELSERRDAVESTLRKERSSKEELAARMSEVERRSLEEVRQSGGLRFSS
eukprot:202165-Chlamydomonas_euryale.AAC.2